MSQKPHALQLSIPSTNDTTGDGPSDKPHTLYHILWRLPLRSATVKKRYNDFLALHTSLTSFTGQAPPLSPPKKHYFGSTVNNPTRTEERRAQLEAYLLAILNAADSRWRDSPAWRSFLALPASWSSGSPHQQQQPFSGGLPSGPITDPTLWLDSHRELKTLLHDARIFLSKRDQAVAIQEQHEASAAAKRCLVKASALISALDSGLREKAEKSSGGYGELLEGEIRRRRDLVAAARQERDALESLANSLAAKRMQASSRPPAAAERNALFQGRGGRVLGAPLPETDRTRELDNEGVLKMQQEILQEQDQGVDGLLRIVQRQKQMGMAIGEELDLQTKMLGQFSEDVDRVDKKTRVARKRADKIS
ncbi:Phox homologous domain-containing protein [Sphaerosporella brunnea]|uniref:Phox homologous domain-containing protein n=1 Tax=Sphaerosporella brunnea TaxID=1250544 RepID=A0A5J5EJA3_9PEZI|nr:Phox homologous domain-containing protein [Sphaerosporella brunnea]